MTGIGCQLLQWIGEMLSVMQQEYPSRSPGHQKRQQGRIRLGSVALPTAEHKVVGTIIG